MHCSMRQSIIWFRFSADSETVQIFEHASKWALMIKQAYDLLSLVNLPIKINVKTNFKITLIANLSMLNFNVRCVFTKQLVIACFSNKTRQSSSVSSIWWLVRVCATMWLVTGKSFIFFNFCYRWGRKVEEEFSKFQNFKIGWISNFETFAS